MNTRQKFWLKVVATVTFPVWIIPGFVLGAIGLTLALVWEFVSDAVDDLTGPGE